MFSLDLLKLFSLFRPQSLMEGLLGEKGMLISKNINANTASVLEELQELLRVSWGGAVGIRQGRGESGSDSS